MSFLYYNAWMKSCGTRVGIGIVECEYDYLSSRSEEWELEKINRRKNKISFTYIIVELSYLFEIEIIRM